MAAVLKEQILCFWRVVVYISVQNRKLLWSCFIYSFYWEPCTDYRGQVHCCCVSFEGSYDIWEDSGALHLVVLDYTNCWPCSLFVFFQKCKTWWTIPLPYWHGRESYQDLLHSGFRPTLLCTSDSYHHTQYSHNKNLKKNKSCDASKWPHQQDKMSTESTNNEDPNFGHGFLSYLLDLILRLEIFVADSPQCFKKKNTRNGPYY